MRTSESFNITDTKLERIAWLSSKDSTPSEQIYLEPIAQIGHDVVLTRGVRSNPCVYSIITHTDIMSDGQVKWVYSHIKRSAMARNYVPVVNWFSAGTDDTTKKLVLESIINFV